VPPRTRFVAVAAFLSISHRANAQEQPADQEPPRVETQEEQDSQAPITPQSQPAPPSAPASPEASRKATEPVEPVSYSSADGFVLRTTDNKYALRPGFAAGIKYEPVWRDGDPQTNGILAFIRPSLGGHFFKPWLRYLLIYELAAETPFIIEANVDVQPIDEVGFVVGQVGTPVGRHLYLPVRSIFFADFSSVSTYFWSGRQKGLTFHGSAIDGKLDYWAGIYGGSPLREIASNPHNYVAEGRMTVNPMGATNGSENPFTSDGKELPGRVSFTVQGYHGKLQETRENTDPTNSPLDPTITVLLQSMTTGGLDLWLQWRRFIFFGEYFVRYVKSTPELPGHTAHGAWGQLLANAYANIIGVGGRFGWINPNTELKNDQVVEMEGQVSWFVKAPEIVLKLRYGWLLQRSPDPAALGSFVLPFPVGTTNLLTLQLTFAF
jgi:hypothetical protein